ncbi:MAG: hypothetical protein NC206_02840 [Bacteroides sp.]|nr:hypothetical protein [Roseburia sp.]MCM1346000.1 hypothetical protein [Bacteroides sp.]MCM1420841.1 hypothetical protein [Bacteroides sp.]
MERKVYETPFTKKMEVELEGNFCSSNEPATIEKNSVIEVESYSSFSTEEKLEINNDITFE